MHARIRSALVSRLVSVGLAALAAAGTLAALPATSALAGGEVGMVVLKEHAVGSTGSAQPFLDKLMDAAAKDNGWAGGKGKFFTKRADAEAYIGSDAPHYGILSLAPFLALRTKYNLQIIGEALVSGGGGQQYFIVSKNQGALAGCKGKTLATDHADDPRFIEKVVAAGAFKLSEFTLDQTTRPGVAGRNVASGQAECALIDDAQLEQVTKLDPAVKAVWSSAKMPPMVVVAFPAAPAAESKGFQANLSKLCTGANKATCDQVGLQGLNAVPASQYTAVIAAY